MAEAAATAEFWSEARHLALENKLTLVAGVILVGLCILAVGGATLAPYDPLMTDASATLKGLSVAHWFGTDALGRDLLSRVIVATRLDLGMAVGAVALSFVRGTTLGAIGDYLGGWIDGVIGRIPLRRFTTRPERAAI